MVTISDVARHCGVNVSTVSRVLNGKAVISQETSRRVLRAVDELGYIPIRKHCGRESDVITLVMPDPTLYTLGATLKEMSITMGELNYDIRIVNLHRQREIDSDTARMLCAKNTAGIILYGCVVPEKAASVFYNKNIPTIVQQGSSSHLMSVCVNNYNGMRDAVTYVLSRGYENIGFVGWEPSDFNIKARLDSYRNVIEEARLNADKSVFCPLNLEGGYQATKNLIEGGSVDAIVYAADVLAYGGVKYLRDVNLRYPDDIGLMGFDDAYMTEFLGLSTMYQLLNENADLVIENLLRMIASGNISPPREILLTPRLVVRDSLR